MKKNKVIDLTLFLIIYIFAYAIGFFSSLIIENMLLKTLVFDVVSTIVIWIFSLILKNSSLPKYISNFPYFTGFPACALAKRYVFSLIFALMR